MNDDLQLQLNNCLEGIELALDVLDEHGGRAAARAILERTIADCADSDEGPRPWLEVR